MKNIVFSTRIKDAGIAIRHSRERILFYTAGCRNEFGRCGYTHKRKLYPRRGHFFVIEKYIEDIRQDEKHVPDLLEATIQPPGLVKEELRPILFKTIQFGSQMTKIRSKISKIRVPTFWIPEIQSFPARGQRQPRLQAIRTPQNPNKSKRCGFQLPPVAFLFKIDQFRHEITKIRV